MMRSILKEEDMQVEGSSKTGCPNRAQYLQTLYTEGLILSFIIDAMEGWDVATADIPGVSPKTDYGKGDIYQDVRGDGDLTIVD